MWHGQTQTGLVVGTTATTAATTTTTGLAAGRGGGVSEERGQRQGEGSDAGAEQGVRPAQDDVAVGAGRHQAVQAGHAPVGHRLHSALELAAGRSRDVGRSGCRYPGRGHLVASVRLRCGKYHRRPKTSEPFGRAAFIAPVHRSGYDVGLKTKTRKTFSQLPLETGCMQCHN